ncbi:patronin isoform X2 [Daktulosphaira vitifoliae]|uniref:patronin isoform X2 n=1 Tax=Daktulosphaira vitifoliae TaxID=58002 RepID=UPI0021AA636F|nr:patronin isoform X2 [Daktulosphaira vitifoliae]
MIIWAKQRATIKWLLSKAYNNRIPDNVIEPFYKDHDNQEHLKPPIVHSLANAELYCLALGNIYSDPNYHNLNHWGVIQALNKKGVTVNDPSVTETVLIQTTPLKLSAHMAIMEAVMTLYAKEVATPNRVMAAIQRLNHVPQRKTIVMPEDYERAILVWVNRTVEALQHRIENLQGNSSVPDITPVNDFHEVSDGAAIAALISFYCPDELPWQHITSSKAPTSSDCIKNFSLINEFCDNSLPFSIFHMRPQDVYYIRGSMKVNLIAFFADLFNVLEIHPAKCVSFNQGSSELADAYPRNSQGVAHKRLLPQAISIIPDLRSNLDSHSTGFTGTAHNTIKKVSNVASPLIEVKKNGRVNNEEQFVVHRNRSVLTLNSMLNSSNGEASNDMAAGKPTHWEDTRKQSYAGRRSRRNSFSEDSQLTVENFGGSQDNLHFIGRNPDKEPAVHVVHRDSITNKITNSYNQENDSSGVQNLLQHSNTSPAMSRVSSDASNNSQGLQRMLYDSFDDVESVIHQPMPTLKRSLSYVDTTQSNHPSSTTTWLQQSSSSAAHSEHGDDSESDGSIMSSQLLNLKLKLEEKRRQIENDKRKIKSLMNQQKQQVGKAAFLQAVARGKNGGRNLQSPDSNYSRIMYDGNISPSSVKTAQHSFSFQDNGLESKWSDRMSSPFQDEHKTPDLDHINIEEYNALSEIHSNYQELQADLQSLTNQQSQLQHNSLQAEMMQHYPGMQAVHQVYQNSHSIQQPQNYMINRQQITNGQIIQHLDHNNSENIGSHQWRSLMNHSQPPINMYNNYNQSQFQHQQQYINQIPHIASNTIPNTNVYSSVNNHYVTQESFDQMGTIKQEPQSQQFFLHNNHQESQQKIRKSWEISSTTQPQTFTQEPQNIWNGSRTVPKSSQPSSLSSSPRQKSEFTMFSRSGVKTSPSSPVPPPRRNSNHVVNHAPLPTPSIDDMQPQSISFIAGNNTPKKNHDLCESLNRIQITSGHKTYRIPSPTKLHMPINQNSFNGNDNQSSSKPSQDTNTNTDKGFYVSFEDEDAPKRPKPPLRTKKIMSKERNLTQTVNNSVSLSNLDISPKPVTLSSLNNPKPKSLSTPAKTILETTVIQNSNHYVNQPKTSTGMELIIENSKPDPVTIDEMEKKKERILLLSLQRRQQQEEMKNRKEIEAQKKKEEEKIKEEIKQRKKEEEKQRRAMILEQHRVKKAIEEAEREGKIIDKELLNSLKINNNHSMGGPPRLRSKMQSGRPRPKTIHVDRSDTTDGTLTPSRGKKGSITNLAALNSPIRRDYYRGSQDCLAETRRTSSSSLYSDVNDDSKLTTPRTLDRHGSYKSSRDSSLDRTKRKTNFGYYNSAPRKSNSLMNLYGGSSCDQDSLLYRYGDTDSGLGRATPPRRAMSPSGPGSLPIRRKFDDTASEAGSDYSGPRLYKQPVTKSNRGIILNAVEYCVFPGVVNRESKKRVLEEINRSEARHFLVLFRDTGCQFRALYLYYPETEEVMKLYGTGPRVVTDRMFDKFFKYNSGGKCFSQVHTKHLTVTIDAFTIHNSLWQGKKVNYPNKKDMTLVV